MIACCCLSPCIEAIKFVKIVKKSDGLAIKMLSSSHWVTLHKQFKFVSKLYYDRKEQFAHNISCHNSLLLLKLILI